MAKTKIVYIPNDKEDVWKEIEAAAKALDRGVGYFICEKWIKSSQK